MNLLQINDKKGILREVDTEGRAISLFANRITIGGLDEFGNPGLGVGFYGRQTFEIDFSEFKRLWKIVFKSEYR